MKIRYEVFVVDIATEIYEKGFYNPRRKPAAAICGENDHFIIGCSLKTFEESQKLSFLKGKLEKDTFSKENLGEDMFPQLVFCLDRPEPCQWIFPRRRLLLGGPSDFQLLARLDVQLPSGRDKDAWKKIVTKEEMFEMLQEIVDMHMDLYAA